MNAIMCPLERRLTTPLLNRWLHVMPVVSLFTLLFAVHKLFARAEIGLTGKDLEETLWAGPPAKDHADSASEDELERAEIGEGRLWVGHTT